MGDMSTEPSMEEILSSIKRIIAEEGDAPPGRGRRPARAIAPMPRDDEVLELSDPIPVERDPEPIAAIADPIPPSEPPPMPAPAADRRPAAAPAREPTPDPIVSQRAEQATRGAFDQLSRLMIKPEPPSDGTLEGLVGDLLRPMLRDWIDANLPTMVEKMVAKEIARITGAHG